MRIIYGIEKIRRRLRNPVVTVGMFDGVHRGHQALLARLTRRAGGLRGRSVVVTFDPHPLRVLNPRLSPPRLTSTRHRLRLLAAGGIDTVVVIPFTRKFSRLSAPEFIENILVKRIGVCEIFAGLDFTFGRDRKGGIRLLKELGKRHGFRVVPIRLIKRSGRVVSSTEIRRLIESGCLREAAKLLGRPVSILGTVVRGDARGRVLGYPTANIDPHHEAIPPGGVYAVRVELGRERFQGILNIGIRPTFKPVTGRRPEATRIEVHILNFRRRIYNKDIEISFVKKIRREMRFASHEALRRQITSDAQKARLLFSK